MGVGIRQEKSFEVLKKRFTIKPILIALNLDKKMRMEINMLDYAIERVFLIEYSDRW